MHAPTPHQPYVIACVSGKGGIGKTTTASTLAALLASELGLRVLVADLDSQAHQCVVWGHRAVSPSPLFRLLYEETPPPLAALVVSPIPGVDLLFSGADLKNRSPMEYATTRHALRLAVQESAYDVVLLDCPALGNPYAQLAVAMADFALAPTKWESLDVHGLTQLIREVRLIQRMDNPRLQYAVLGVCVDDAPHARKIRSMLREQPHVGEHVLSAGVRHSKVISRAQGEGAPIHVHSRWSNPHHDYRQVIEELRERGVPLPANTVLAREAAELEESEPMAAGAAP